MTTYHAHLTTYHVHHVGRIDDYTALLNAGWTVLGSSYPPISPSIDIAVWLRCPPTCCPAERMREAARCADCGALALPVVGGDAACRCGGGE